MFTLTYNIYVYKLILRGEYYLDKSSILPLILSVVAGLSTVLGAFIVFISKSENKRLISFALAFSAGVMITISFTDLFPSAEIALSKFLGKTFGVIYTLLFILCGILMALLIDKFIPEEEKNMPSNSKDNSNLYRVGFVSMIAIMLHNFPEGIATFISGYEDISLGIYVTIAIALHNIPEGISVAIPIYYSTKSKLQAIKMTFISGIAEPIGALITFLFLKPFINELILGVVFAVVAGIMLYISFGELIPTSRKYGHHNLYLLGIFIGILFIPLTHIFLS